MKNRFHLVQRKQMKAPSGQKSAGTPDADILKKIIGARLTSVCFVLDYLTIGFDERGALTSLVWPDIGDSLGGVTNFGNESYRNRICDLITQVVKDVQMSEDETITISFENGVKLVVRLRDRKDPGERAIFTAPKHHLQVW